MPRKRAPFAVRQARRAATAEAEVAAKARIGADLELERAAATRQTAFLRVQKAVAEHQDAIASLKYAEELWEAATATCRDIQEPEPPAYICVVCLLAEAMVMCTPCNHLVACQPCTDLLRRHALSGKCPVCRQATLSWCRIFPAAVSACKRNPRSPVKLASESGRAAHEGAGHP